MLSGIQSNIVGTCAAAGFHICHPARVSGTGIGHQHTPSRVVRRPRRVIRVARYVQISRRHASMTESQVPEPGDLTFAKHLQHLSRTTRYDAMSPKYPDYSKATHKSTDPKASMSRPSSENLVGQTPVGRPAMDESNMPPGDVEPPSTKFLPFGCVGSPKHAPTLRSLPIYSGSLSRSPTGTFHVKGQFSEQAVSHQTAGRTTEVHRPGYLGQGIPSTVTFEPRSTSGRHVPLRNSSSSMRLDENISSSAAALNDVNDSNDNSSNSASGDVTAIAAMVAEIGGTSSDDLQNEDMCHHNLRAIPPRPQPDPEKRRPSSPRRTPSSPTHLHSPHVPTTPPFEFWSSPESQASVAPTTPPLPPQRVRSSRRRTKKVIPESGHLQHSTANVIATATVTADMASPAVEALDTAIKALKAGRARVVTTLKQYDEEIAALKIRRERIARAGL